LYVVSVQVDIGRRQHWWTPDEQSRDSSVSDATDHTVVMDTVDTCSQQLNHQTRHLGELLSLLL